MMYCTPMTKEKIVEVTNIPIEQTEQSQLFDKQKYLIVQDFFDKKDVERMSRRMWHLARNNMLTMDPQCPKSIGTYGDPIQAEMMLKYQEKLENVVRLKLNPTYTFARIYKPKEILSYHSDRPSCQISLTTTLDFDTYDDKPWPIWVESDDKKSQKSNILIQDTNQIEEKRGFQYLLYPGDILVYKGCELKHWREMFVGVSQTQVFMHYVDANGPYGEEYKYDGRASLGSSEKVRRLGPEKF